MKKNGSKKIDERDSFSALLKAVKRQAQMDPGFQRTFAIDCLPNEAYKKAKIQEIENFYLTA